MENCLEEVLGRGLGVIYIALPISQNSIGQNSSYTATENG